MLKIMRKRLRSLMDHWKKVKCQNLPKKFSKRSTKNVLSDLKVSIALQLCSLSLKRLGTQQQPQLRPSTTKYLVTHQGNKQSNCLVLTIGTKRQLGQPETQTRFCPEIMLCLRIKIPLLATTVTTNMMGGKGLIRLCSLVTKKIDINI